MKSRPEKRLNHRHIRFISVRKASNWLRNILIYDEEKPIVATRSALISAAARNKILAAAPIDRRAARLHRESPRLTSKNQP